MPYLIKEKAKHTGTKICNKNFKSLLLLDLILIKAMWPTATQLASIQARNKSKLECHNGSEPLVINTIHF